MALSVTHSTAADGTFSASGTTAWDAAHSLTGVASASQGGTGIAYFTVAGPSAARTYTFPDSDATILYSGGALGTPASGTLTNATGLPEAGLTLADNTTNDFSTTKHGFVPKGTNVGSYLKDDGTWAAVSASATLNGISAATGAATIASGNNTGIVWNWANTTNTTVAFTFGETTAATNGTLNGSGVPNQVLLKLATLAASTQSPLSIYVRGAHAFSISPSSAQILGAVGAVGTPSYSFAALPNCGMYCSLSTGEVMLAVLGIKCLSIQGDGSSTGTQLFLGPCTFAKLGTPANGTFAYCSDCDPGTLFNSTCTSSGTKTGSFARRINGAWLCD